MSSFSINSPKSSKSLKSTKKSFVFPQNHQKLTLVHLERHSELFTKFVNLLMTDGKKGIAFTLLWKALSESRSELIRQTVFHGTKDQPSRVALEEPKPLDFLETAIRNIEPSFEIRNKKIAGMTRHIPAVLSKKRGESLAIRWLLESAQKRRKTLKKGFSSALALELVEAYLQKGQPRQKRDALHKAAESNRAFLRYRWW